MVMIKMLRNLFGAPAADLVAMIKDGAQVIDVRSRGEFVSGHLKGSVNIPLQELPNQLKKIKKETPVIVCCASGVRSNSAKNLLKSEGFIVYNGGSWSRLEQMIKTS
jgi:phage shock protein E